jgi:hypothetical protein
VSTTKGSGISGRSKSAGTGQCINRSEPQCWCMIGKPDGRVLTERRSTPLIGSRLTLSDSALVGGRAQVAAKVALKVAERRRRRSGVEVWEYGSPG